MREIVLDTETTGLNFKGGDRIIEIGCVEVINHVATENTLQFYCRTNKEISPDAQKISSLDSYCDLSSSIASNILPLQKG